MDYEDKRKNENNIKDRENVVEEAVRYGAESKTPEEIILASKSPGEFTIEDFENLPDVRYEIYEGNPIKMYSGTRLHQDIMLELAAQIKLLIKNNGGKCKVHQAWDMKLDDKGKDVLCPDIMVVCREHKGFKRLRGPADWVIEILSKSTEKYDKEDKLKKYKEYGVREYWIVDPYTRKVIIHDLENDNTSIYSFDVKIPVGIYGGKMEIDFNDMDYVNDAYNEDGTLKHEDEDEE